MTTFVLLHGTTREIELVTTDPTEAHDHATDPLTSNEPLIVEMWESGQRTGFSLHNGAEWVPN